MVNQMEHHVCKWFVYGVYDKEILLTCPICGDVAYVIDFTPEEYTKAKTASIIHHQKNGAYVEKHEYPWIGTGEILFRKQIVLICEYSKKEVQALRDGKISASFLDPDIIGVIVDDYNEPLVFTSNSKCSQWIAQHKSMFAFPKQVCVADADYDTTKLMKIKAPTQMFHLSA